MRTIKVSTLNLDFTDDGKNAALALAVITSLLSARARNCCDVWPLLAQRVRQHRGSGVVHRGSREGFDGLQIESARSPVDGNNL
jgi:hypothetical protein